LSKIIEFECVPKVCTYSSEEFKIYGTDVNREKYPNIKLNKYENVTISGNTHTLAFGITYLVKAEEVNNKYGVSYKILNIRRDKPQTLDSSRNFLSEIITPRQVDSILNAYPNIIDKVINNDLDDIDLSKTPHIKDYIFNVIKTKIIENFALIEIVDFFKGNLDIAVIRKLYYKYPSLQKIKTQLNKDPYKCLCGLARIGFRTADNILLNLEQVSNKLSESGEEPIINFDFDLKTSKQRSKACIMFCLEENQNNGHTKTDIVELRAVCRKLAPACIDHFVNVVRNDEHIFFDSKTKFVALKNTYETELFVANKIIEGLNHNIKWDFNLDKYKEKGLTEEQFGVLPMICNNNIMVLNGNGGSGKTFTTITLLDMLKENNKSYLLFSPTGRASKILANYCKYPASTIHRGLGFKPPNIWEYNSEYPLHCDVLVVDEFSMVDIFIMQKLVDAIDFKKTKLLIIGDSAQIPSVGAGNILHDIINSQKVPKTTLTKIFRYGIGGIMTVATNTRESKRFLADTGKVEIFGEDKGYVFIPTPQQTMINKLMQLYKKLLIEFKAEDVWVLTAYNKGEYGSININSKLQVLANAKSMFTKGMQVGDTTFYKDDLVLNTVNNYKAKIYKDKNTYDPFDDSDINNQTFIPNGEIGTVLEVTDKGIIINFDGVKIIYDKSDALKLKLAYSISLHKSQGSQNKIIIILTPKAHTFMLNSNLLYVGQTRTQLRCYHMGDVKTVNNAIKEKVNFNRNTFLQELLQQEQSETQQN